MSVTTGQWIVDNSAWKRWGYLATKVIKRTPKTITLGVTSLEIDEQDEIADYVEGNYPLEIHKFKIHDIGTSLENIVVPKKGEHKEYCIYLKHILKFDTFEKMGEIMVRVHTN